MGMGCQLFAVRDATITRLQREPALVWRVVAPDDPELHVAPAPAARGFFTRLLGRRAPSQPFVLGAGEGACAELDKAWHGIHYLLTRTAWEGEPPWNLLVRGAELPAGDGVTVHAHRAVGLRRARDALASVTDAELRARFDPADMSRLQIYPDIWTRDRADDDTLGWLLENVAVLRRFLDDTAGKAMGCLVDIG